MITSVLCRKIHAVHGYGFPIDLRLFLTVQISIFILAAYGQDITVINHFNDSGQNQDLEQYVLKNVIEHTYIVNEYELANTGFRSQIDQMISYGIRSYIDNNYHIYDGRVETLVGKNNFISDTKAIVRNAVWIHDQPFADDFDGYSNHISKRIDAILLTDGYLVKSGDANKQLAKNSEVGLYTFQRMVYDLKKACELEAEFFLDKHLPRARPPSGEEDDGAYLSAKNYQLQPLSPNMSDLINDRPQLDKLFEEKGEVLETDKKRSKRNKNSSQLTERVVELLEQNSKILISYNDRFENLQQQINSVRKESNTEIKEEISELRAMISNLSKGKVDLRSKELASSAIPNEEIVLIFEKNAYELTLSQKAFLNQALAVLREGSQTSALITGYADKTGNADLNAWISKKRAVEVENYLVKQGISKKRLVVNFLGDTDSNSANPLDRKVSVEYFISSK